VKVRRLIDRNSKEGRRPNAHYQPRLADSLPLLERPQDPSREHCDEYVLDTRLLPKPLFPLMSNRPGHGYGN
jgi:hypothetical protein